MKTLIIVSLFTIGFGITSTGFADDLKQQDADTTKTTLGTQTVDKKDVQAAKEEKVEKKVPFHATGRLENRD